MILYFTYPKNNVFKAAKPLLHEEYFSTPMQLLSENTSITPLQAFILQSMGVCSVKDTQSLPCHIRINKNITKKIHFFFKIFKPSNLNSGL